MKKILFGFIAIGLLTFVECGTSRRNISTIKDVDGNTYKTVKIGTQEWMAENLIVEHFSNGDIIQAAKTDAEWYKAGDNEEPAWCYYDNNSSNGEKYGKLYNFYAVIDPRGLAPDGWHVPTNSGWTLLRDYLSANGNEGTEGDALKSKSGWNDVDDQSGNGTDDYGFNGLPGGQRYGVSYSAGSFDDIGNYGHWWSSSQDGPNFAWKRSLLYLNGRVNRGGSRKESGFSVRCLRD